MLKKIFGALVLLIVGILGAALFQPDSFRLERSIEINRDRETIFNLMADFNRYGEWSPWEKLDGKMKKTITGDPGKVGMVYQWEGNKNVGKGRMEITHLVPLEKITIQLDFLEPFEAHNIAEYLLTQQGEITKATWAMSGKNNFMGKIIHLFASMDSLVGKDFEEGLMNLKKIVEKKTP